MAENWKSYQITFCILPSLYCTQVKVDIIPRAFAILISVTVYIIIYLFIYYLINPQGFHANICPDKILALFWLLPVFPLLTEI